MKKLFLTSLFAAFFLFASVYGQTDKGTILLGGWASGGLSTSSNNNSYYFNLNPDMGVFVANKFAIGLSLYSRIQTSSDYTDVGLGVSPFLRFYFATTNKTSLFVPMGFGISSSSSTSNNTTTTSTTLFGNTGFGFAYFINPSIALETSVIYNIYKTENADPRSALSLNLGFQIHFKREK